MDHLHTLISQVRRHLILILLLNNVLIIVGLWLGTEYLELEPLVLFGAVTVISSALAIWLAFMSTTYLLEPVRYLWQAILHVAPEHTGTAAPNLDHAKLGRQLITSLCLQVYQLASSTPVKNTPVASSIASALPLPLLIMNREQTITFANERASAYLGRPVGDIQGQNFYSLLDLSFADENTYDDWLTKSRTSKATDNANWEHVKARVAGTKADLLFDLAAHYSKDNPDGAETIVTFFDHNEQYGADDQALSFIALAVHELRTPLTVLRGYIEVFEDELADKLDPELSDFMHKMNASAQQLTAFVSNILNVARVEDNQLTLQLTEESWADILNSAAKDLTLRAQVHGKKLQLEITPDLPKVGVDRVSIYEVLNNLVDNAIKYSDKQPTITIKSYLKPEGMIETTVHDDGVGVPEGAMDSLFEKFYRNHRNRSQIGGTGLGLYLSKAIVTAHGGQIWVQSKPGEGSTFGFTVQPFSKLADDVKNSDNDGIVRGAHGWIKNHSLYRR